jgi:hypothetical protein
VNDGDNYCEACEGEGIVKDDERDWWVCFWCNGTGERLRVLEES